MGKAKLRDVPDLAHLAQEGAQIAVRVTPRAARDAVALVDGVVHVRVTAVPENGRANAAVQVLLAAAMEVAPSCLELVRGQSGRDKVFTYAQR